MAVQQRSQQTRRQILQAASDSFASIGYDGSSVAEICQRAGVSKGAFYHHFESKHSLFTALLNDWLVELDQALSATRDSAGSVPEALLRMVELTPLVFKAADGRLPIFLQYWTQATREPGLWDATVAPYRRYRDYFAELLRVGMQEGTVPAIDADTVAQVIVSMAVGLVLQGSLDPQGADWPVVTRAGMQLLLRGLEATGSDNRKDAKDAMKGPAGGGAA